MRPEQLQQLARACIGLVDWETDHALWLESLDEDAPSRVAGQQAFLNNLPGWLEQIGAEILQLVHTLESSPTDEEAAHGPPA